MNSMTGFGVARGKIGHSHIVVEARSVNHRFCEVNFRFPGRLASLEPEATRLIRERFSRGKFDLFMREEAVARAEEELNLAKKSFHLLKRIQRELNLPGGIALSDLLSFRQILHAHHPQDEIEKLHKPLLKLVNSALDGLLMMREREGRRLQIWFTDRIKKLHRLLSSIEKRALQRGDDYRLRLETKLRRRGTMEEERLLQEAAVMAERADVTEEIVRLRSHLKESERQIHRRESIGRKFDFLAQEMGREINTIGSKSQGVKLAHDVIEFKGELERLREQIQNIE